jgi:hypothetical protein
MKSENHRIAKPIFLRFGLKQSAIIFLAIASSFTLLYLTTKSDAATGSATLKEKQTMMQTQETPFENVIISTLDASIPARTETATFALG